jgi:hypothetical protein
MDVAGFRHILISKSILTLNHIISPASRLINSFAMYHGKGGRKFSNPLSSRQDEEEKEDESLFVTVWALCHPCNQALGFVFARKDTQTSRFFFKKKKKKRENATQGLRLIALVVL